MRALSKVSGKGPLSYQDLATTGTGTRRHGGPGPHSQALEEVGKLSFSSWWQGLLLDGVIGSRVFVKQVDQG